ncbi:uncharacterized protein FTJAE_5997 [Fusarium tjaetaba]|uniref:Uncharacterized protein n=1 Tax=Fusarium tjaetaba TaxID=1567544 RepID=A0A8H5RRI9_9HYPO|nr:uncharacterized protein FTJAE_5997 [Fusarium tjaetaba]KAF5636801.1 hypothetical protein FTJAE_5997 [Fusarium tjaetaba]
MKFSIVLAIAALSAETFACANIGQVCNKGDPDVCQCDAPLTLSCRGDLVTRPGGDDTADQPPPVHLDQIATHSFISKVVDWARTSYG